MLNRKRNFIIGICSICIITMSFLFGISRIFAQDTEKIDKTLSLGYTLKVDSNAPNDNAVRTNGATYQTIQGALDSAIDGDTIEVAEGTYRESIIVRKSVHLKGAGIDKSIIQAEYDGFSVILGNKAYATTTGLDDLSGLTIEGFTIKTTDKTLQEKGCIYLAGYSKNNSKIIIKNNKLMGSMSKKDVNGYGIYTPTISKKDTNIISNIYITHNTIENVKNGMNFSQLQDSVLESNTITNTKLAAIMLHATTGTFQNISIEQNTIEKASNDYKLSPTLCGALNFSNNQKDIKIEENTLSVTGGSAICVKYVMNTSTPPTFTIRSNKIYGNIQNYIKNYTLDCSENYIHDRSNIGKNVMTMPYYVDETLTKLSDDIYSLTLSKDSLILNKGEIFHLTYELQAGPEAKKDVVWSSLDEGIATVDNGKVKAIAKGTTAIVLTAGSKKAICPVSVCVTNKNGENIQIDAAIPDLVQSETEEKEKSNDNNKNTEKEAEKKEQTKQLSKELLSNPFQITVADSILNDLQEYQNTKKIEMRLDLPSNTIVSNIENKSNTEDIIDTNIKLPDDIYRNNAVSLKALNVSPAVFEAAKENGKDLNFNITDNTGMTLYNWEFKQETLTSSKKANNLCLNIQSIDEFHRLKSSVKDAQSISLDFEQDGNLPGTANVKIFLGKQNFHSSDKLYLYYDNKETKTLEYVASDIEVTPDLYATISIDHCSSYVLSDRMLSGALNNPPLADIKVFLWIPIIAIVITAVVFYYHKKFLKI